jgi:hypothetical protein
MMRRTMDSADITARVTDPGGTSDSDATPDTDVARDADTDEEGAPEPGGDSTD